jgi:GABA permease
VAPTLVSATHYLDSDVDEAREEARARLAETVAAFEAAGVVARGEIGSESPLEAIADAVAIFAADEIVVATPPSGRTNWLERGVVERARELYDQPVSHLVVEAATPVGPRAR